MIYLDTNVIGYALENHPKYGAACKRILKDVRDRKLQAAASLFVLVELLGVLVRLRRTVPAFKDADVQTLLAAAEELPIQWVDIGPFLIQRAAAYTLPLNGYDYLHLATMEQLNIDTIVSADQDFDIAPVRRLDPLDYRGL